ncbi:TraX family protein [Companilactobacillus baiquanensis]|uniref:TraX family protein n=1 Tax=Companilactobacillus baiquanensis TaxID=2486005 RepID=A0ABW1UV66_9LACO|nr:TraX family protein [Companilactobacillus baiquanensis]
MQKFAYDREVFKIILMLLMVLDHISYFISPYLADTFHLITRVVAVGFGYLVIEGLRYTHNKRNYLGRLFGWGIFMLIGNFIMNQFLKPEFQMSILGDNIFLTLFLGAIIVTLWESDNRRNKFIAFSMLLIGCIPLLEGSYLLLPFMFITNLNYDDVKRRDLSYLVLALFFAIIEISMTVPVIDFSSWLNIYDGIAMNASSMFFILIIPMLHFYNGKQGRLGPKLKYLFYIFYPLHLWIIHLLANYVVK